MTPLVPAEDERPAFVARALSAYAAARGIPTPEPPAEADYTHERYQRALYLHVDALLQVLRAAEPGVETSPPGESEDNPLAEILHHERRAWWRPLEGPTPEPSPAARSARGSVHGSVHPGPGRHLRGRGRSLFDLAAPAAETATRTASSTSSTGSTRVRQPDGHWITPLEPDLLGEELLRQALSEDVELLEGLLDAATERQSQDALAVVGGSFRTTRSPWARGERP